MQDAVDIAFGRFKRSDELSFARATREIGLKIIRNRRSWVPAVLRYNADSIGDKVPRMAEAMRLEDKSFDAFYTAVCEFLNLLDIPKTLADIGVSTDCAPAIAAKAIQDSAAATNPRQATVVEVEAIIKDALAEGR